VDDSIRRATRHDRWYRRGWRVAGSSRRSNRADRWRRVDVAV